MNISALELRHLRYFVAVVEAGSFRAAALRLHVSQPPLTRQVQRLESIVGTQLLVRSAKGVTVTEAGHAFYREARNILDLVLHTSSRAKSIGDGNAGRIDIGVFGSPIFDMVPRVIGEFKKRYPKVQLALHTLNRAEQLKALRDRMIDVGFNRFFIHEPGLKWEIVETQSLNVAVFQTHRLATRKVIRPDDLADEELIFYPRSPRPGFADHILAIFARQHIMPQKVANVDDVPTAIAMVASNLGVTIVPNSASNLRMSGVRYVPLASDSPETVDSCAIYRDEPQPALLRQFLQVTRSHYRRALKAAAKRPATS